MIEKEKVFIPQLKAYDRFTQVPKAELDAMKALSSSGISSTCPAIYFDRVQSGEKYEPSADSLENFIPGKREHAWKERENKYNPFVLQAEDSTRLLFSGNAKVKPFILRITPDAIKLDTLGQFIEDYKTTNERAWYFKFKEYSGGISFGYKMQESIYAYGYYCATGHVITDGVIVYIDKDNPRRQMAVPDKLFTFTEVESFIFSHPAVTGDTSTIPAAAEAHKKRNTWTCGYCDREACIYKETKEAIEKRLKECVKT